MTGNAPARFAVGYAAAFAVYGAAAGQRRVVAYLVVLGLCAAAVRTAHKTARFTPAVQWALAMAGLLHLIGGILPGKPIFYETWLVPGVLKYDQAAHFTIVAIVTVALWQLVGTWVEPPVPRAGIVALMAMGLGALNEVFEFLSALRFADAYIGDAANTGWDLVFNAFGALSAAAFLALSRGASSSPSQAPRPSSDRPSRSTRP